jgi:hypothetical protein
VLDFDELHAAEKVATRTRNEPLHSVKAAAKGCRPAGAGL